MISEKVGNPILVITEYLGVLANLGLYTEPSYPNPEVIFHDMNETLMNIWLEQALPTQRNNAKRMDKELNETMEIISDEELLNVEVGEDDSEVILDETWKEMKALYGNKKYAKTQIEKTTHLLIGDAITIYERVIDNILVSYLEHYSVSPLQNSSKQCLLRAGMKEVYPIIGELIKDEKIREYYLKTGNNIYFNSKHYMRPSSNQLDVFKNISKEILNQEKAIEHIGNRLDYNELFVRILTRYQVQYQDVNSSPSAVCTDMAGNLSIIKKLLLLLIPKSLNNDPAVKQNELLNSIRELSSKIAFLTQEQEFNASEWLNIQEIDIHIQKEKIELLDDIGAISGIRDISFSLHKMREEFLEEYDSVIKCYNNELYKQAVIGCGTMTELMLKEYMLRNKKRLTEILVQENYIKRIFKNRAPRGGDYTDVTSWELFNLVQVCRILLGSEDKFLSERFDLIRKARNTVHGGKVDKRIADYAITTVWDCYSHLLKQK